MFILAFKSIGRQFILKTGINVLATALIMGILPVPAVPFLEERLANAIIGGISAVLEPVSPCRREEAPEVWIFSVFIW